MAYMLNELLFTGRESMDGYPFTKLSFQRLKPADLVYFPGHMALYLETGNMFIRQTDREATG